MGGILCDLGAAVLHNSVPYNCRVLCVGRKIVCIRPQLFLADDGNYREPRAGCLRGVANPDVV
jgi:NAD+ synthase (glutamine-hydrolysing)